MRNPRQALSAGTNSFANALTVYNGQLIAAGLFTSAGGVSVNLIARWNGTSWQALGSGITGSNTPDGFPEVYALAVYNGELIVGGSFAMGGGVFSPNLVRWNGTSWLPMNAPGIVTTLAVINGDLLSASSSNHVVRWTGSTWAPVGDGSNIMPSAFAAHNGNLVAASISGAARWDGESWTTLGQGFNDPVEALISFNGELFIGGDFTIADGNVSAYWARLFEPTLGDVTCDGTVNTADLLAVINSWGPCPPPCAADLTGDGFVNVADLLVVINNWG